MNFAKICEIYTQLLAIMSESIFMQAGKSYIVIRPGETVSGVGEFPSEFYQFRVLDKPKRVLIDDGPGGLVVEIPTPEHLLEPCWHFVLNLKSNKKHWFCDTGCIIEEMAMAEKVL